MEEIIAENVDPTIAGYPSTTEWLNELWYMDTVEYYLPIKWKKTLDILNNLRELYREWGVREGEPIQKGDKPYDLYNILGMTKL